MTTDHELLELAAKAVGVDLSGGVDEHGAYEENWNPLTYDDDEARLESVLGLWVSWYPAMVLVGTEISTPASPACAEYYDRHNDDKQAARRRAGVRAAAAIGEAK
ncbi:MAG: hypothetical protein JJD98_00055 [Polaromonas sp.]|nr:hypothetical protein [Polaromonas sp.]